MDKLTLIKRFAELKYTYSEMQWSICEALGVVKMVSELTQEEVGQVLEGLA